MFEVVTANPDRSLLTIAELRAAVGAARSSSGDVSLLRLGKYIAATITKACRVVPYGAVPPNLRLETVRDTFRSSGGYGWRGRHAHRGGHDRDLILSRRPVVTIIGVVENGVTLTDADYEVHAAAGMLRRLCGGRERYWPHGTIVVDDTAGWATVPDDLKFAATRFVELISQQAGRDPLLRMETIPGVMEQEWWVEPSREVGTPPEVLDMLDRGGFVNEWVG